MRRADGNARDGAKGWKGCGSSAGEQEIASGNGQINIPVLKEATPLSSQYRRGFDRICCFFLILEGQRARPMRPNAPIKSPRGPNRRTARLFSLAVRSKTIMSPYFDAVGSGCGLSDSEFR